MREELVKRLIAQASDDLIRAIYRRIVADQGRRVFSGGGEEGLTSWDELVSRAVQEGVLDREEAAHLLEEIVGTFSLPDPVHHHTGP